MSTNNFTESQNSLINLAKEVAKKLGTTSLSPLEFRESTGISDYTIAREFGGWTELCRSAGLEIPNRYAERSDDELLEEMRRVFETSGKRVNVARFDALSKFSSKMYRRRFGSWTEALSRLEAQSKKEKPPQSIAGNDGIHSVSEASLVSGGSSLTIATYFAQNILRFAIDLLKSHPTAFQAELAEIRTLVLEIEQTDVKDILSASPRFLTSSTQHDATSTLAEVACWLANSNSISISEFRTRLLPLSLLPSAAIDAINEFALDICGEIAVEEIDDEIVVTSEVIDQVNRSLANR